MTRRAIKKLIKQYLKKDKFKEISTGWVMTSCPFAEWLHADRDDKHFSFGISTPAIRGIFYFLLNLL